MGDLAFYGEIRKPLETMNFWVSSSLVHLILVSESKYTYPVQDADYTKITLVYWN